MTASNIDRHLERRGALKLAASAAGLAVLASCRDSAETAQSSTTSASSTSSSAPARSQTSTTVTGSTSAVDASQCVEIPTETAGPYPGDGSNGLNVLTRQGIVRSDITADLDGAARAAGVPLTVRLHIVNLASCAAFAGAAVYLWHADALGRYSGYSNGVTDNDYLRGVQIADDRGVVEFTTVFPACYDGRWPHIHFEIYPNASAIASARNALKTTQLAFPKEICQSVYGDSRYTASSGNLQRVSLATDMVFRDDVTKQLASVSGDANAGVLATLTVGVRGV